MCSRFDDNLSQFLDLHKLWCPLANVFALSQREPGGGADASAVDALEEPALADREAFLLRHASTVVTRNALRIPAHVACGWAREARPEFVDVVEWYVLAQGLENPRAGLGVTNNGDGGRPHVLI